MFRQCLTNKWFIPILLSVSCFCLDFFSKLWANSHLHYGDSQIFLPGFLRFTLTRNTGGAFGILRAHPLIMTFLAFSVICAIVIWMLQRDKSENPPNGWERCGVGIIIGSALGNLYDRLTRGEVTDFLEFTFMDFPVFNLADALIDLGAGLVIIGALTYGKVKETAGPAANEGSE